MTLHRPSPSKRAKCRKRRTLRHRVEELEAEVQRLRDAPQLIILTESAAAELLKGRA